MSCEFDVQKYQAELEQQRTEFLTQRARDEIKVQEWADKLAKVNPEILQGIDLPTPLTLRTLTPEAYVDEPDEKIYEQQFLAATELIEKINAIVYEADKRSWEAVMAFRKLDTV